ncbi:phosphonate C-P lyase system protein PhnL [Rhodospirillaceae bacterium KN72]|uniref:Phosphonate C-P lyase system protein PhnL n=1 Tax=Pacificispira spongiicola TaxID=2729598 RepID=A0A7Y0DZ95_9PROT|nr:phosphonate C-P lyase system protein PhnL [Pacificispira spongiicola]NMM44223.1 phosphonate C-P lyase system protein PhnL [Pacificispira spongiicola]
MQDMLKLNNVAKSFTLYNQSGIQIPVFEGLSLSVEKGECVALAGPSGMGKSTLMRMIYGNYLCPAGAIDIRHRDTWVDIASADPRVVLDIRRWTLGYISQFLRVVPRVSALDVVAEPLVGRGMKPDEAREHAAVMLGRLNLPESLWHLAPATFSGGEQQRVNIARGFVARYPVMLLDEPTASLDKANREAVLTLIEEAKSDGVAVVGIFHDAETREAVCTREFLMSDFKKAA